MKFLCGSCRTKYQISDQKVRGKILTIRCKKCGSKIIVKESLGFETGGVVIAPVADGAGDGDSRTLSEGDEGSSPSVAPISTQRPAEEPVSFADSRSELEATRLEMRARSNEPSPKPAPSSGLASAFEVALQAAHEDMPTNVAPVPATDRYAGVEWFVASDGQQRGPFAFAELVKKIESKEAEPRHYAWHDGFDGWKRIRDIPDLAVYIPKEEPKRAPVAPPPPDFAVLPQTKTAASSADVPAPEDRTEASGEQHDLEATQSGESHGVLDERHEQLDDVLNQALGIAGEGRTARAAAVSTGAEAAEPRPKAETSEALALGAPAGLGEAPSAIAYRESTGADQIGNIEDLFASIPRASDHELVARESTRLFVAAAGVNSQKSRNRLGVALGVGGGLAALGLIAALVTGALQVQIPGIGNPFGGLGPKNDDVFGDAEYQANLSDEEKARLKGIDGQGRPEKGPPKKSRPKPRPSGDKPDLPGEYVQDDPNGTKSTGPRGDDATGSMAIGDLKPQGGPAQGPMEAELPTSDLELPPVDGERLSAAAIRSVVSGGQKAVEICHQQQSRGGDLRGKLEVNVTVQPSGAVSKAEIKAAKWKNTPFADCVIARIKEWKFPQFSGAAQEIVIPFLFE